MDKTPRNVWGGYYLTSDRYLLWAHVGKKQNPELKDYKVWCFNGEPKLVLVCTDRFSSTGLKEDFFDCEWNHLDCQRTQHKLSESKISKPAILTDMLKQAAKLSAGLPFSRIDFYQVDGQLKFGEITFFPSSGFQGFVPEKYDTIIGDWLALK